ncbi:autotransporter outer membrane beta-barrel domain-containing protein [uncultured Selenomonas sp.]|uniref:autotransporter outer membrane beta-barrel domain-containing protein n=1 Tax=uncultured Selenomonas sp. TaxID=159275 RepID=UPI0028D75552|nr:autotransporter outer membrane beta-barrel domain-containing protein [uncultured Selenomonas sp.]
MKKTARMRKLAFGITAALLAGAWQAPAWAAEQGPIKEDLALTEDTTVTTNKDTFKGNTSAGFGAVYANGSLALDMAGHNLTLDIRNLKSYENRASGLQIRNGSTLTIDSNRSNPSAGNGRITIKAHGGWNDSQKKGGAVSGIRFDEYAKKPMRADINADVHIDELWGGTEYVRGVWAPGNATLNLNGTLSMRSGAVHHEWTERGEGDPTAPSTYGIHVSGKNNTINIRSVDIADPKIQRGIQFGDDFGSAENSTVRIGGGTLKIADNTARNHWLMWLQSKGTGKVYFGVNEAGTDAGTEKTELAGSIHTNKNSEVYLGLNGAASKWTGGTESAAAGKTTLYLKNGASWDTTNGGRGTQLARLSSTDGNEGHIFQNDTGSLTIDDYAGRQRIYYRHTGDGTQASDYAAGDTHIVKAAANSAVTMVTDHTGVTATDADAVHRTLNALAGKLYYDAAKNGEQNLTGRVMLAEGLTASSAERKVEGMNFSAANGQGSATGRDAAPLPALPKPSVPGASPGQPSVPAAPDVLDTTQQIAEVGFDSMDLSETWKKQGYGDDEGHYTFGKDVIIRTKSSAGDALAVQRYYTGGIVVDEESSSDPKTVNMRGHRLTLNSTADNDQKYASGITVAAGTLEIRNAGGVDINISGTKRADNGIYAMATSKRDGKVIIDNEAGHAVKIRNTTSGEKGAAIQAKGAGPKKALVDVKGLVDIEQDQDNLLKASYGGEIRLGGGRLSAGKDAKAAEISTGGKVFINAKEGSSDLQAASTERDVSIDGNVSVEGNGSSFDAALTTERSYLKGKIGGTGSARLLLSRGARWENQSAGTGNIAKSHLTHLKADGGEIHQNDTADLSIDRFEGKAKLFYKHEGNGSEAAHYKAGNTHIKSAAEHAEMTVVTDAGQVNTADESAVHKTLNALAGKLYYDAAAAEHNLKGKAMIAEGLTSSSASKKLADITFLSSGQGSVKEDIGNGAQIAEGDWSGAAREQRYWDTQSVRSGSNYTFTGDAVFSPTLGGKPVKALNEYSRYDFGGIMWGKGKNGSINMNGHALSITTGEGNVHTQSGERRGDESTGILVNGGTLEMKALGKTTIDAQNNGIHLVADRDKGAANLHIKNAADNAVKITSRDKGIFLESYNNAARLTIDGDVDINAPQGVVVDAGTLTIGGGRITSKGKAALYVNSPGTAKINADMDGAGNIVPMDANRDVQIEGDVQVKANSAAAYIGLTTKKSVLKGLFTTDLHTWPSNYWELAKGNGYLTLRNGGTWEHVKSGTGMDKNGQAEIGDSRVTRLNADGGIIRQKDRRNIIIDEFLGNMRLVYEHVNDGTQTEDYGSDVQHKDPKKFYGDTHIGHAAKGSSITMVTDSNGVNLHDESAVRKTLNALAGKLYYDGYVGGERNLSGKAAIAEGLTGSAVSQQLDLDYWASNGRAYVKSKDTAPLSGETIEKQIAEGEFDANDAKAYWKGKGVYDGNGNYTFNRDINLVTKAADKPVTSAKDNKFGTIYWNGDVNGTIDMTGHRLGIKAGPGGHGLLPGQGPKAGWEHTPNAITVYSGTLTIKNVKGMNIESDPSGSLYGRGIFVMGYPGSAGHKSGKGAAKLVIENDDDPAHAVKIRVKETGEDFGAIEARKNMGSAEVDIKGLVDIDSKMWRAVESHGARVSIGGGIIKGTDVASIAAYDHGKVFVNAKLNDDGSVSATSEKRPVQITGDISAEGGGHVVLGLNNKESFFKGLVSTDINGILDGATGKWGYNPGDVSMRLANGATWEHKQVGTGYHHKKETGSKEKGISMDSRVTRLDADKGILKQSDPHKLTIDNYSGNMRLVYEHVNDGTKAANYQAGDVHIKKAAAGSSVTMVTDSNGVNLHDETAVRKTLNALAGKLYYDGYAGGERNLKGEATISEGLTASSRTLKTAAMGWAASNGQGSLQGSAPVAPAQPAQPKPEAKPEQKPPTPAPKPQSKIEYGDYETKLMSGVKSAMTVSTMAWRAEANDLMKRMGDLRLSPESAGIWARVYRGKSSSNKDNANFNMNYSTIQVGYDKQVAPAWRVGIAGSYMSGSSSYAQGSGDNKEGNLGVYGTWTGKSGQYVDLIAKVGRLQNKYSVYNEYNHYVKGDFSTWGGSVSAEYGRRFVKKGGIFFEPQVEMIYSHLNGVNYTGETDYVGQKMHVRQGSMDSLVGRFGLGFGQETSRSTWFTKVSLYHEFAGALGTDYSDGVSGWKSTHQDSKDTWIGLLLGGTVKVSDKCNVYGDFEKTFAGDVKTDWRVDAGVRWNF